MGYPESMNAVVIDGYGEPGIFRAGRIPVPPIADDEVLIEVAAAGVGVWDAGERSGAMAALMPAASRRFPRVIGGDGSGRIVAVGAAVAGFSVGDEVYGSAFTAPKGGFYAEYVAAPATQVAKLPAGLDMQAAAALAIPGVTALRGLHDVLQVGPGHRIAIFGASGGVGYLAVQLANALGARVLAAVQNEAGERLVAGRGADHVVQSGGDLADAARRFAPDGLDGILATANGTGLDALIAALRPGGKVAYPHGVHPEPAAGEGREALEYNGTPGRDIYDKLAELVAQAPFDVHVSDRLPLAQAADAHRRLMERHLGV